MSKTLLDTIAEQIDPIEAAWFDLADLVAEQVAVLLDERGWSQRELARRLGKPESYVSRLMAGGQNVTLKTLAALHHAFGEPIVTTPAQVERDLEEGGWHGTLELLGWSYSGEAQPLYDEHIEEHGFAIERAGGAEPPGGLSPVDFALGEASPERFYYAPIAR